MVELRLQYRLSYGLSQEDRTLGFADDRRDPTVPTLGGDEENVFISCPGPIEEKNNT